ncbi:MAG TPA: PAS domain S-box protein, partial [Armatimonadota bacterium]
MKDIQEIERSVRGGPWAFLAGAIVLSAGLVRFLSRRPGGATPDAMDAAIADLDSVGCACHRRAREQARESERFAHEMIDALSQSICVLDERGVILTANKAWHERLFANPAAPGVARVTEGANYLAICDAVTGGDQAEAAAFADGIRSVMRREQDTFTLEHASHLPSEDRWYIGRVTRFAGPGPLRIEVMHEDITERKLAEEAIRAGEARLRAITESAQDAILMMDPRGLISFWNPAAERIFGYSSEEAIGQDLHRFLAPQRYHEAHRAAFAAFANTSHGDLINRTIGLQALLKDGEEVPVELSLSALHREDGWHSVGVIRDITERKRAEHALRESNDRLLQAQAMAHVGNWELDLATKRMWGSKEAWRIYGLEQTSPFMPFEQVARIPIAEDRPGLDAAMECLVQGTAPYDLEFRIVQPNSGQTRVVNSRAHMVCNASGVPERIIGVIQDVTERKQTETKLRESEERFRALFEHSSDMVAVIDAVGTIMFQCSSIERILGYDPASVVGSDVFDLLHPDDRLAARRALNSALAKPGAVPPMEVRVRHRDGSWRHIEIIGNNQLHRQEIGGVIINTRDITERKRFEEEMRHQAFHDSLTGLPNRILFRERVEHALVRASRHDRSVAVLFIDLDHFKVVNDSLGHQAGDHLLVEAAGRIRSCLRAEDTAARLGGDEFTVLLEEMTDNAGAALLAERILRRLGLPYEVGGRETFVNASIGIVVSVGGQDTADDMLRKADVAMYQAKGAGRGRYVAFRREMSLQAQERMEMETDLRRAIERGEFRIYYQPIINMETSAVTGVEALARWDHPKYGLMAPDAFIPIQEQIGLMGPFTMWVLKEAQMQCLEWSRTGRPLTVSVNLSPVNL